MHCEENYYGGLEETGCYGWDGCGCECDSCNAAEYERETGDCAQCENSLTEGDERFCCCVSIGWRDR